MVFNISTSMIYPFHTPLLIHISNDDDLMPTLHAGTKTPVVRIHSFRRHYITAPIRHAGRRKGSYKPYDAPINQSSLQSSCPLLTKPQKAKSSAFSGSKTTCIHTPQCTSPSIYHHHRLLCLAPARVFPTVFFFLLPAI